MRPIDADPLKESLQQSYCKLAEIYQKHQGGKTKAQLIAFIEAILRTKDQPTLDVEPVRHGRWVHGMQCSYCKQVDTSKPRYCPTCGARMDVKEECE